MAESKFSYIDPGFEAVENTANIGKSSREVVKEALAGIHHQHRQAIELYYGLHDGKSRSLAEVGRELGISPATAKRWVEAGEHALKSNPSTRRRFSQLFDR